MATHLMSKYLKIVCELISRPNEVPKVLNYLTAPNVLIWSAACASTAATYPLYSQVHLLAKDDNGVISKWSPGDITWTSSNAPNTLDDWIGLQRLENNVSSLTTGGWGSLTTFQQRQQDSGSISIKSKSSSSRRESRRSWFSTNQCKSNNCGDSLYSDGLPHHRLAELFNVNHIIVSQAGALTAPMVLRGWRERHSFSMRVLSAIIMEVRHRTAQAAAIGLIPSLVARWITPETITGDVTITPELSLDDYRNLFSNPTSGVMNYWIKKGEKSTWPLMSLIKNRCAVEFAIDRNYHRLRSEMLQRRQEAAVGMSVHAAVDK